MEAASPAAVPELQATSRPQRAWLLSESGDFWFACAGGGLLLVILALVLLWVGDRELSTADILLGELHLGATYGAIVHNRLWRRMQLEVIVVPLCILAATYALILGGYEIWVATAALYLAAWHRGRQNLGTTRPDRVARFRRCIAGFSRPRSMRR